MLNINKSLLTYLLSTYILLSNCSLVLAQGQNMEDTEEIVHYSVVMNYNPPSYIQRSYFVIY